MSELTTLYFTIKHDTREFLIYADPGRACFKNIGPVRMFKTIWACRVVILSSQISCFEAQVTSMENVCKWLIGACKGEPPLGNAAIFYKIGN